MNKNIKIERIKVLNEILNKASDSYYNDNISLMENREYNVQFDELKALEDETGVILSSSPTQRAGFKVVNSDLPKIKHDIPLLSLGKINEVQEFVKWLGDKEGVLMLKMDGGTGKAEYNNQLVHELSTRGGSDTNEGENISHNIHVNIPNPYANIALRLKRDRKIMNKMELTRLQRNFEFCMKEIDLLEKSKASKAIMYALIVGIIGTAFMAGSVFAVTASPPMIILCIILAVPAFAGWILPYYIYKIIVRKRTKKVSPLIEEKQDEVYEICEKGSKLLY